MLQNHENIFSPNFPLKEFHVFRKYFVYQNLVSLLSNNVNQLTTSQIYLAGLGSATLNQLYPQ